MLNLADLDSLKKRLIVILVGIGDKGVSRKAGLQRRNFIRLIDKAINEYEEARKDLVLEIEEEKRHAERLAEEGWTIYEFSFIDHLENCINATRRLLAIVDKIKGEDPPLISRETRRLVESWGKELTKLRDSIEHMDEKIQNDEIQDNQPVTLSLSAERDKVSVGNDQLTLEQLGLMLRKLHHVGESLLDASPTSSP